MTLIAAVVVALGVALVAFGVLQRGRDREEELRALIELPYADEEMDPDQIARASMLGPTFDAVDDALGRLPLLERIGAALERARIPLRPTEFVLLFVGTAVLAVPIVAALTGQVLFGVVAAVAVLVSARVVVQRRARQRQRTFEQQLPDALSLAASSLEAGHSFQHAVAAMIEESEPPLSEEFARALAETKLGDPLVEALERIAQRTQVADMEWVVQAVRIQQEFGGPLARLLFTLADTLRTRDEFRREVRVLTAEGRVSAAVLSGLPILVLLGLQLINSDYMSELFRGVGALLLGAAAVSVLIGMVLILRMVRVEM